MDVDFGRQCAEFSILFAISSFSAEPAESKRDGCCNEASVKGVDVATTATRTCLCQKWLRDLTGTLLPEKFYELNSFLQQSSLN